MTTLKNRPNTALIVIDVQNGVVAGSHERDAVVANVGSLVEKAREAKVPVVWVQHSDDNGLTKGSDSWKIVPELAPVPVIVLSALDQSRAAPVDACAFLKKPLDFDRLLELVRDYCR